MTAPQVPAARRSRNDGQSDSASMPSLTLVIPSYNRRGPLERLLRGIRDELLSDPALTEGFDVVVVLDGSDDGSAEMVEAFDLPVPLRCLRQPHTGRAGTRNAGLRAARGELLWFLDDDMVPAPGLVACHRRAARDEATEFVAGACLMADEARATPWNRMWAEEVHSRLSSWGTVRKSDFVAFANLSGPRRVLLEHGGFDEQFAGWGGEDADFGVRLLEAGVTISYDPEAVAWHHQARGALGLHDTMVDQGRNLVRLLDAHPFAADEYLIPRRRTWVDTVLASVRPRTPLAYRCIAVPVGLLAGGVSKLTRRPMRKLHRLSTRASTAAGMAELDTDRRYLPRFLGIESPSGTASRV